MDGTEGSASQLSSILSLLGGSGTTLSVDGTEGSSSQLSSILSLLGGSGTTLSAGDSTSSDSSSLLSSILGLLGGSGTTLSAGDSTSDSSSLLSSILSLLGGSGTTLSVDGTEGSASQLSSILSLLGGSGTTLSTGDSTSDSSSLLSSILGLLGGSGTTLSAGDSTSSDSSSLLSSILSLLGGSGSGTTLSVDGLTSGLSSLSGLASIFNNIANLGSVDSWDDLSFLDNLSDALPNVTASSVSTTIVQAEKTAIFPAVTIQVESSLRIAAETPKAVSVLSWGDDEKAAEQGYQVEITCGGDANSGAIRVFTAGTSFDVAGGSGSFSCRAALRDGDFADAVEWVSEDVTPRQITSNANGRADVFFATSSEVWSSRYCASNAVTGTIVSIGGKNRIRDTFSGSASDANILYLTDGANGDALFMDDVYSEFGSAARINLIREIRSGAGDDVIDMTSSRYQAELAGMTVRGGSGDDILWGADGGNMLFGDEGNDRITGGSGNDIIAGGTGNDTMNGGGGDDVFAFCDNWGSDTVEQISGGSVTLWFEFGSLSKWNAETLTYADGENSVKVSGVSADMITLNFGNDKSELFARMSASGAFSGFTSEKVFEEDGKGLLASL